MRPRTVHIKHGDHVEVTRTATIPMDVRRCNCGRKKTYTSKKLAKAIAKQQSKVTGDLIEAYHCYAAHGYHIGHPPGSRG